MGSVSIDLSLPALWHCWQRFVRGKKRTAELHHFIFHLEENLKKLASELINRTYKHGSYRSFCVNDTKHRDIAVASIKDRLVHRLLYEYLVKIYDKTFIYDVWSCREGKGLLKAIGRAQKFLTEHRNGVFWRGDVKKFFDSVDHRTLLDILCLRVRDEKAMWLLKEVIDSYTTNAKAGSAERERAIEPPRGIAIGNVTSQIFSNIYLNEFDRHVKHTLYVKKYLRYGDDFVIFTINRDEAMQHRKSMKTFLWDQLSLDLHSCNDVICPCRDGLKFLGCMLYPTHRHLQKRVWHRVLIRTGRHNVSSYSGLIRAHCNGEMVKYFDWHMLKFVEE